MPQSTEAGKLSTERTFTLILPKKDGQTEELKSNGSILFIGANGSGKTRLGTWVEFNSPQYSRVHRISAQKSLSMPDHSTPISITRAENDLLYGYVDTPVNQGLNYKQGHKFKSKPAISFLDDYEKLMVYLFSEYTEETSKYLIASKASEVKVTPPITKLDKVKEVWEKVLPHRELLIGGLRIQTKVKGSTAEHIYSSSEMSDGERVIFYLVGQCLAAQQDGIVVIDEPELHLHKSVQSPLWLEIEKLRPDCLFVYLTHDVDFASSQEFSQKIWLKSFDGSQWEWEKVEPNQDLPEELLLEVLGSRRPVIFVEGESGSYDSALYRAILDGFLVVPRGSSSQVIQSVKAMKANTQLHHLAIYGIVDRDRRVAAEILALEGDGIFVLEVAEVENLFCTKEILALVSRRLARKPEDDFAMVSRFVFDRLSQELEAQISMRTVSEIRFRLGFLDERAKGEQQLKDALQNLVKTVNVGEIYADSRSCFEKILATKNYNALLKVYNRKSLSSQISASLDLSNGSLPELVIRLAKDDSRAEITNLLKPYFGNFASKMA